MTSFDTNILFYSLNPQSQWHAASVETLEVALVGDRGLLTDWVLLELHNLLRNTTLMTKPLSAPAATKIVTQDRNHPNITRAENAPVMDEVWKMAAKPGFPRRRILDLRPGLTRSHHGVTRFATANVKELVIRLRHQLPILMGILTQQGHQAPPTPRRGTATGPAGWIDLTCPRGRIGTNALGLTSPSQ